MNRDAGCKWRTPVADARHDAMTMRRWRTHMTCAWSRPRKSSRTRGLWGAASNADQTRAFCRAGRRGVGGRRQQHID